MSNERMKHFTERIKGVWRQMMIHKPPTQKVEVGIEGMALRELRGVD